MRKGKLLVILVVALLLLVGCGKKESDEAPATVQEKTADAVESSTKKNVKKEEKKTADDSKDKEKADSTVRPAFDIVQDCKIVYSSDNRYMAGTMSVSYLQLKDGVKSDYSKLSDVLDDINEESRKEYDANMSDFIVESQNFYDRNAAENMGYGYNQCWNLSDITVTRADEDVTSFFIRNFNFWGGGEAADRYKCVNLDSKTGQALEFSDIVTDETGFGKAIEELFKKKFGVALNVIGNMRPSTFDWCLTPIGINVYFPKEYPAIASLCGNYLNIGFDAYPGVFNKDYRPKNNDYVYPFDANEDLYADIDNDGKANKISFGTIIPEGAEETNECEGYTICIDDVEYNDFGETWFYDWQPYYVHTADGAYIYAYLSGYETDKVDIIKLDRAGPKYEKSVAADNLYGKEEPGKGDVSRYRSSAFTSSDSLLKLDFATGVCGKYIYQPVVSEDEEGMGEWLFEIYEFDGKYYIEELSDFNYGAAEIELLSDTPTPCTDGYSYRTKIHYFSGFSFAGDFHGSGYECDVIVHEDGSIVLAGDQPFGQGGDIILFPYRDSQMHYYLLNEATENLDCPSVIGAWRCSGTNDDNEKFENYLELYENGTAVLVSKTDAHPVNLMIGAYQVFNISDMHESTITFCGEIMGYACQPSDEMEFTYDTAEDTLTYAPYGFDDADSVIEYHRTSKGEHDIEIAPGPTSRTNEIKKNFEEYSSIGEDDAE